jgi:hypothetical protein
MLLEHSHRRHHCAPQGRHVDPLEVELVSLGLLLDALHATLEALGRVNQYLSVGVLNYVHYRLAVADVHEIVLLQALHGLLLYFVRRIVIFP